MNHGTIYTNCPSVQAVECAVRPRTAHELDQVFITFWSVLVCCVLWAALCMHTHAQCCSHTHLGLRRGRTPGKRYACYLCTSSGTCPVQDHNSVNSGEHNWRTRHVIALLRQHQTDNHSRTPHWQWENRRLHCISIAPAWLWYYRWDMFASQQTGTLGPKHVHCNLQ